MAEQSKMIDGGSRNRMQGGKNRKEKNTGRDSLLLGVIKSRIIPIFGVISTQ